MENKSNMGLYGGLPGVNSMGKFLEMRDQRKLKGCNSSDFESGVSYNCNSKEKIIILLEPLQ